MSENGFDLFDIGQLSTFAQKNTDLLLKTKKMQIRLVKKNIFILVTALLLITVFAFQVVIKSTYTHSHKLAEGKVITHAHPYDKANDSKPFKSHNHTQAEFVFIANLEIIYPFIFLFLSLINISQNRKMPEYLFLICISSCINLQKNKGPPVSSYLFQ